MRNLDDYSIEDLEAALSGGRESPPSTLSSLSLDDIPVEDLEQAYALQKTNAQPKAEDFSWLKFVPERFAQSIMKQIFNEGQEAARLGTLAPDDLRMLNPEYREKALEETGFSETPLDESSEKSWSNLANEELKKHGVNLESQGRGNTAFQRMVGEGVEMLPYAMLGAGSGAATKSGAAAKSVKDLIKKGIGKVGTGAKSLSQPFATGFTSGALKEAGVPEGLADITAITAVPATTLAAKKIASPAQQLARNERKVADYLKDKIGEKELPKVAERLKNPPIYEKSNYIPTSAEVAENPTFSQLHRLRYESPGSGLPEHLGVQNDQLVSAIDRMLPSNAEGVNIQGALKDELKSLKKIRRKAVDEGYQELKKDFSPLNPKNAKKYLKESRARGDIKKDLDYAKEQIRPSKKEKILEPEDAENIGEYFIDALSPSKREALGFSSSSKKNVPSVSDLSEGRKAINSRYKRRLKTPGREDQALELKNVITELDKDLAKVPLHEKIVKTYHELSQPISHIKEHPGLRKILKTRLNNQITAVMDTNSSDNIAALRKAVGKDKALWNEITENVTDHFMKSIKNAGAEGRGASFSQPKFKRYIEKHGKTLKELYNKDQMELVNETGRILRGQNIAKTLGAGPGSPTYSRLTTDLGFKAATGIKKAAEATTSGVAKKGIVGLLTNWARGNQEKVMSVLDRSLREPEFAHKLISYNPKNQVDFNRFVNQSLRQAPLLVKEHNEERENDKLR